MDNTTRTVAGFIIAPVVVPLSFALYDFWFGNGRASMDQFIGVLLNYGAYAYIFALVIGFPMLLLLRRIGANGPIGLSGGGAFIGLCGASVFYAIGLRSLQALAISFVAGAIAGFVFWLIAHARSAAAHA